MKYHPTGVSLSIVEEKTNSTTAGRVQQQEAPMRSYQNHTLYQILASINKGSIEKISKRQCFC
jgi:hypothetical protein